MSDRSSLPGQPVDAALVGAGPGSCCWRCSPIGGLKTVMLSIKVLPGDARAEVGYDRVQVLQKEPCALQTVMESK